MLFFSLFRLSIHGIGVLLATSGVWFSGHGVYGASVMGFVNALLRDRGWVWL